MAHKAPRGLKLPACWNSSSFSKTWVVRPAACSIASPRQCQSGVSAMRSPKRCLAARIADGLFATAIDGDVLKKRATGGLFVCEDPRADAPRVFSGELDPAGPLPGHSLFASRGEAARREQAVLAESHIDPGSFASAGEEMQGARRPYRIAPNDLRVEPAGDDALVVSFALPKGSYAVSVLREISKNDVEEADSGA